MPAMLFSPFVVAFAAAAPCPNYALARARGDAPCKYLPHHRRFFAQDSDGSNAVAAFSILPSNGTGAATIPVAGDWDGDGFDGVGTYDVASGVFELRDQLSDGPADHTLHFGPVDPTARPVAGDWDGSGRDSVGVYYGSSGTVLLRLGLGPTSPNVTYRLGPQNVTWWPFAADFTGGGRSSVGLFDPEASRFYIRTTNTAGPFELNFTYGAPNVGGRPVAGRWPGSPFAHESVGLVNAGGQPSFQLKYNLSGGSADIQNLLTNPSTDFDSAAGQPVPTLPVVGRWRPSECRSADAATSTAAPRPPKWLAGASFYNMNIQYFTREGTFDAAIRHLDHVASLGVTAVLLLPVSEARDPDAPVDPLTIFYGVRRPDVIEASFGGAAGLKRFVKACHRRGLKVVVDNVPDGLDINSPYVPSPNGSTAEAFVNGLDVFRRDVHGELVVVWSTHVVLDWTNPQLVDWWSRSIGVPWVREFDIDGFRCDEEPWYGNNLLWTRMRADVLHATGKELLIMSEGDPAWGQPADHSYAFHLSQHDFDANPMLLGPSGAPTKGDFYFYNSTTPPHTFAAAVASCAEPFASRTLTNHDYMEYVVHGRVSAFVYGTIIGPFAPHFFTGEEFNQTLNKLAGGTNVLYFQQQNWSETQMPAHRALTAAVARAMAVRHKYLHVLHPQPGKPINTSVAVAMLPYDDTTTDLPPYVLTSSAKHQALAVLASRDHPDANVRVLGFPGLASKLALSSKSRVRVVDLLADNQAGSQADAVLHRSIRLGALEAEGVAVAVESGGAAVLLIEHHDD